MGQNLKYLTLQKQKNGQKLKKQNLQVENPQEHYVQQQHHSQMALF